jgi:hypothetical protein
VLEKAEADAEGVKLTWKWVNNAPGFMVYRDGTPLANIFAHNNSFVDKTAVAGTTYKYKIVVASAYDAGGAKNLSNQSNELSILYIGTAKIDKLELSKDTTGEYLDVVWVSLGADHYRLYRKTNTGSWILVTPPAADQDASYPDAFKGTTTSYKDRDIVNGSTYAYYVKAFDSTDAVAGTFDAAGKSIIYYAAPTITKVVSEGNAVRVEWEQVGGIFTYLVERKLNDASWQEVARVPALTYLDTAIASGAKHTYRVRCLDEAGNPVSVWSIPMDVVVNEFYEQPLLTGVTAASTGIKVTWQAVSGAPRYMLFRKDDTKTSWDTTPIHVTNVGDPCEWIDTTVLNGGKYSYTVACADASSQQASDYNQTGLSTTFFNQPVVDKLVVGNAVAGNINSIKFSWQPVDGISTYDVYRKSGSGSWLLLASNVSGTEYVDTNLVNAQTYSYSVSCTVGGVEVSAYDQTGLTTQYFKAPEIVSVVNKNTGVEVTIAAVDGAKNYKIYRREGDNGWGTATTFLINSTSSTIVWTDTSAQSGHKYTYTVRCRDNSGLEICSGFDTAGKSLVRLDTPSLGAVSQTASRTLRFSWSSVAGASKYIVYMKTGTGGWVRQRVVTGTTYTATNLTPGIQYTFTVRATNDVGDMGYYLTGGTAGTPTW